MFECNADDVYAPLPAATNPAEDETGSGGAEDTRSVVSHEVAVEAEEDIDEISEQSEGSPTHEAAGGVVHEQGIYVDW